MLTAVTGVNDCTISPGWPVAYIAFARQQGRQHDLQIDIEWGRHIPKIEQQKCSRATVLRW